MKPKQVEGRWQCKNCGKVVFDSELLSAPSPFDNKLTLLGCPACKDCAQGFDLMCDEPGCNQTYSMGWPTGDKSDAWGGYRQTCYRHGE